MPKEYENRERLLSELSMEEGKLLVLSAAIGYGKTVLMSQLARLPGYICAWYHLDVLDNEPETFFHYLFMSLDRALGGFCMEEALPSPEEVNFGSKMGRRLTVMLEERMGSLGGRKFMLALDDLQVLENPEIFHFLEELLDYTGHGFLLVAATRKAVPGSFTKYFMSHQGRVLGSDRLSLQKEEFDRILNRMLPPAKVGRYGEMIWENMEGWPAGIMLTILYLSRLGSNALDVKWEQINRESWVQNYIACEIFRGLPHDMKRFLLRSSFAEEMNPALCNHICRIQNAGDILQQLLTDNIFLAHGEETEDSYRLHPMFRSFLNGRAGEELGRNMYAKISAFYQKCQDETRAAKYASMAEKSSGNDSKDLLQVSCFGRFRVVVLETGREIAWRTRKAMELFAYLVDLEGRPVERRVLLEKLWPDDPPVNEVAMLHNMIYSIRKELKSQPELNNLIQYKGHQYYLDTTQLKVDLESKKQICKLTEKGKARELYEKREELLYHWDVYLKEVDGTWCMARRAYFERTYGKACVLLADYCRKKGDLETEVSCWNAYWAADRYAEEAVAGMLRCYADMGERHQMQRIYESAEKIFREEMEMELSPEIRRIYDQGMKKKKS